MAPHFTYIKNIFILNHFLTEAQWTWTMDNSQYNADIRGRPQNENKKKENIDKCSMCFQKLAQLCAERE